MASYLQQRQGIYYLRFRIPFDVSSVIPDKEVTKSLRTRDKKSAELYASKLLSETTIMFTLIRGRFITDDQARERFTGLFTRRHHRASSASSSPTLSEVIAQYKRDHRAEWSDHTFLEYDSAYKLLIDVLGSKRVSEINRDTVRDLRDLLVKLPSNANKKFPGKTIKELTALEGVPLMSITTVNKRLRILSSLMKHCIMEGHITSNPVEGLKIQKKRRPDEERKAYDREDLQRIVRHLPTNPPERYWIPMIAMYSGMRLGELCGLHVADIKQIDGIWCFDINGEDDKSLKTSTSKRIVPIHPALIEKGFLAIVESMKAHKRLWPNLKRRESDGYCPALGKWFQRFNRQYVTDDPKKSFHSMRHSFADTLKQLGVQESLISELMGHANESITTGRYGKRYQAKVLLEAVSMIE